jgi:hypothetical protein
MAHSANLQILPADFVIKPWAVLFGAHFFRSAPDTLEIISIKPSPKKL